MIAEADRCTALTATVSIAVSLTRLGTPRFALDVAIARLGRRPRRTSTARPLVRTSEIGVIGLGRLARAAAPTPMSLGPAAVPPPASLGTMLRRVVAFRRTLAAQRLDLRLVALDWATAPAPLGTIPVPAAARSGPLTLILVAIGWTLAAQCLDLHLVVVSRSFPFPVTPGPSLGPCMIGLRPLVGLLRTFHSFATARRSATVAILASTPRPAFTPLATSTGRTPAAFTA